jgi:hypothetical protein
MRGQFTGGFGHRVCKKLQPGAMIAKWTAEKVFRGHRQRSPWQAAEKL